MFVRLFLLFTLVPLADLLLLIMISKRIPWWTSVLVVVGSGMVGAWLARQQWGRVKQKIGQRLRSNQPPGELVTDGMLILMAGGMLIAPGLITDALGMSLLIPACRRWYKKRVAAKLKGHFQVQTFDFSSTNAPPVQGDVVEGKVVDE